MFVEPVRELDSVIDEMERLNLAKIRRVPVGWQSRLDRVVDRMPQSCRRELKVGGTPSELMDALYEMQSQLLRAKLGDRAADLDAIDAVTDAEESNHD